MYEAIALIAGIVAGALLIEIIDLHRNRVELEKLQEKEIEEPEETEEEEETEEAKEENEEEPETHFTVCLEDGMIIKVRGESVSNGICGTFTIEDGDGNVVFKTSPSNVKWWGVLDCLNPVDKEREIYENH